MTHVLRRAVLVVLTLVALNGCATADRDTGPDATRPRAAQGPGLLIEPADARSLGYVVNWAQNLALRNDQRLAAAEVLGDLLVTVQQPSNLVTAVSLRDGEVRWQTIVGGRRDRLHSPTRIGDLIVIASDDRMFAARASTGEVVEVQDLSEVVAAGPVAAAGLSVVGSIDGTILGQDLDAGYPRWRYDLTDRILTPPLPIEDDVFAGDASGAYALLGAEDGSLRWRGRTFGAISARAAADSANIYIPSRDRALYAVNRATGRDQWVFRTDEPVTQSPFVARTLVLQPLAGSGLVALDSIDGAERWRVAEAGNPVAILGDDRVLVANQHRLRLVDLEDGDVLEEVQTRPLQTVLAGPEGSLILVSPGGRLLRINPQ